MALKHQSVAGTGRVDRTRFRATRAIAVFACVIGLSASAHAAAQDYPSRKVGEWTIASSRNDRGCFLTRQYDRAGDTTLLLGLDGDGTNHLSVLNANWSIKPKDQLSLTFRLSKGGYATHGAVGMESDGKPGFVTTFEAKFPSYFAASAFLDIFRGDVPVEQLGLDGSGAAVAAMRDCVGIRAAQSMTAPGVKTRDARIPADPFAPDPPRKPRR